MKLTNLDTILSYISLILAICILLSIIFGCYFKKNKLEHFATKKNNKDVSKDTSSSKLPVASKPSKPLKPSKPSTDSATSEDLSKFESGIIEGLTKGTMTNKDLEGLIKEGTFTSKNLNKLITYVESKQ